MPDSTNLKTFVAATKFMLAINIAPVQTGKQLRLQRYGQNGITGWISFPPPQVLAKSNPDSFSVLK